MRASIEPRKVDRPGCRRCGEKRKATRTARHGARRLDPAWPESSRTHANTCTGTGRPTGWPWGRPSRAVRIGKDATPNPMMHGQSESGLAHSVCLTVDEAGVIVDGAGSRPRPACRKAMPLAPATDGPAASFAFAASPRSSSAPKPAVDRPPRPSPTSESQIGRPEMNYTRSGPQIEPRQQVCLCAHGRENFHQLSPAR
jgi:hypothetical protein